MLMIVTIKLDAQADLLQTCSGGTFAINAVVAAVAYLHSAIWSCQFANQCQSCQFANQCQWTCMQVCEKLNIAAIQTGKVAAAQERQHCCCMCMSVHVGIDVYSKAI